MQDHGIMSSISTLNGLFLLSNLPFRCCLSAAFEKDETEPYYVIFLELVFSAGNENPKISLDQKNMVRNSNCMDPTHRLLIFFFLIKHNTDPWY